MAIADQSFAESKPRSAVGAVRAIPYLPIALAVVIVAGTYWSSPNFKRESGPQATLYAGDFLQEWLGGYIVRAGDYSRFYNVEYAIALQHDPELMGFEWKSSEYLPIVYPPFYYLLVSPLSRLPIHVAAWLWGLLMTTSLAGVVMLVVLASDNSTGCLAEWLERPMVSSRTKTLWHECAPWLLPLAMFFQPLMENLVSSQKGTVCLLILTSTFLLLDSRRPFSAGLVFGLLAFKPQLTLVIAFSMLFKRQWRFVGGGAITGAALVAISFVLGADVCYQYFRFSTGMADYIYSNGYDITKSHCLYGFFALLLGTKSGLLFKLATGIAAIGVIATLARLMKGELRFGSPQFAIQFAGLVLATVLLSPHLFSYDLTILLLPMFLLIVPTVREVVPAALRNPVIWLATLLFAVAGYSQDIAVHTHVQITAILMVGLLMVLAKARTGAIRNASPV